jgi:hypothetical protein
MDNNSLQHHFWTIALISQAEFFLRILGCSQGGDHPKTNLANSGYMPDMKVKSTRILLYSSLPTGTNCRILTIWIFFFSKFEEIGPFFPRKILSIGRNHISQVDVLRKFANKITALREPCTSPSFSTSPNLRKEPVASCRHNSGVTILPLGFSNRWGKQEGAVKCHHVFHICTSI